MLEMVSTRPPGATTIYIPDANLTMIEQFLRSISDPLEDAFANHGATLTLQTPTQSVLAGWILTLPVFNASLDHVLLVISKTKGASDRIGQIVDLDMQARQFGLSIESYSASAIQNQTQYTIADLTA